jgi:hypothetical protein
MIYSDFQAIPHRSIPGVFKEYLLILKEVATVGYLSPEAVFMDALTSKRSQHQKKVKKAIPEAAKACEKRVLRTRKRNMACVIRLRG